MKAVLQIGSICVLVDGDAGYALFQQLRGLTFLDSHYGSGFTIDATPDPITLRHLTPVELAKLALEE